MSTTAQELVGLDAKLRSILDAESAPIMGPCLESIRSLNPELLQDPKLTAIRTLLGAGTDSIRGVVSCLRQWPTITVLILTEKISEAYGEGNDYAVHQAIAELLGQRADKPLSNSEKKLVWREFRHACYKLGLNLSSRESGVGYMVEEFLHQAGLPLSFVPKVTQLMLRTGSEVGLPDEDDPTGIARWQECLLDNMKYLPPTARKSIQADQTGFYVRTFLRACNSLNVPCGTSVAAIMAEVVAQSRCSGSIPGRGHKVLRIPRLLWRNDELLVELPASDDDWTINVDGEEQRFRGSTTAETIPILCALPKTVEVRGTHFTQSQILWEDKADNRFLIFDSDGRWFRSSAVDQPAMRIPPGDYTLVLRFEPDGMSAIAHLANSDPDLYVLSITLLPGQKLEIQRGPAQIEIAAEMRPWISFSGKSIRTLTGDHIWQTEGLHIDVAIGNSAESEEMTSRQYIVRFNTGGVELGEIAPENGRAALDMVCSRLGPGIHRIVADLCPAGTQRVIARTAGLLWKCLERQDSVGRLFCSQWPENLFDIGCENALLDRQRKQIGPRDSTKSKFQLEFHIAGHRTIILEWLVPGIFMQLDDYASTPVEHSPVSLGMTLAATSTSRQVLRIRSTAEGQLLLQGKPFKSIGANRPASLHVSSLAEMLEEGTGELDLAGATGRTRLLQLTAPHQIHHLAVMRTPYQYKYQLRFASRCSHVHLHAQNILTDEVADLTVSCDNAADWSDKAKARLESDREDAGLSNYCLTFQSRNWSSGAWLIDLDVRLGGRWGSPTNLRQDRIACGLLIVADGTTAPTLTFILPTFGEPTNRQAQLERFERVHRALQKCYALESWQTISWLKDLWKGWLQVYLLADRNSWTELIRYCAIQPPEGSSNSWLPMQRIESSLPILFSMPAGEYTGLQTSDGVLADSLRTMASIERPLLQFPAQVFCTQLACGFGLRKMSGGGRPTDFDFDQYCQALLTSPLQLSSAILWHPSPGDYLGRDHYQIAWEQLRNRYRETLPGNEIRRQFAIPLCLRVQKEAPVPSVLLQSRGRGKEPDTVEGRFLEAIEVFISSLASACRTDVRRNGTLTDYRTQLAQMLPVHACSINDVLSYVLQLGRDMFSFYLLLWEIVLTGKYSADGVQHV